MRRVARRIINLLKSLRPERLTTSRAQRDRLKLDLDRLRSDFEGCQGLVDQEAEQRLTWALRLVDQAEAALGERKIALARHCLTLARRERIYCLDEPHLDFTARTLQLQIDILMKYSMDHERLFEFRRLFESLRDQDVSTRKRILHWIEGERDQLLETNSRKLFVHRFTLVATVVMATIFLIFGIWYAAVYESGLRAAGIIDEQGGPLSVRQLPVDYIGVAVFGALGAAISLTFRTAIPFEMAPLISSSTPYYALTRPIIGATTALIVVLAFESGVITALDVDWVSFVWILASVAGFGGERFIIQVAERVEPIMKEDDERRRPARRQDESREREESAQIGRAANQDESAGRIVRD